MKLKRLVMGEIIEERPKVDWLKHRIQPFFMLKMPEKQEVETTIEEPRLSSFSVYTIGEL